MRLPRYRSGLRAALGTGLALASLGSTAAAQPLDSSSVAAMRWRNVGPANFMGRLSDVVGIPSPSKTVFVAAAAGGIWKSTNNGITWRPTFDDKRVISMGVLAIAPSDTMQVWAGTGEPNSRNSIDPGGGIYKSTDGGLTWTLKGLEKTEAIGRIVVHPTNPNVVYVAALGATWRSNPERGLYKTTDGGNTWQLVKFVSDKAGFIDITMHPTNPDVLFAASWERYRNPYSLKSGGPGSALWKTTDGGATWTEVKGGNFPAGVKGRMSVDFAASNPNYVYAMVEGADPAEGANFIPSRTPKDNGLWRSTDGGATWTQMNNANTRPFYYSLLSDPKNPERVYFSSTQLQVSDDGGKTSRNGAQQVHVDDHGLWIDPNDPQRWFLANDGGVAITYDAGGNFLQPQNLPIAQFYEVSFDMAVPYNICGGAQDNGTWCGPSRRRSGNTPLAYWFTIAGGDGFYAAQDPTDPAIVYGESQGGNVSRVNLRTGERYSLQKPGWQGRYAEWEDSIAVVRGDPLVPASRDISTRIAALRARQAKDSADMQIRYNWNSPFFLSPHNPSVLYFAGNKVMKSMKRGEELQVISPDLSKNLVAKLDTSLRLTGGITLDATGAETYGTVVALEESPRKPGLLSPAPTTATCGRARTTGPRGRTSRRASPACCRTRAKCTSRASKRRRTIRTFYVAFDNHRWGDFKPYLFRTKDGGRTFSSIVNNLPVDGPGDFLHVVREDPHNPNLLFVGTSIACTPRSIAARPGRASWPACRACRCTICKIHPRDHELIAATHGRGFWIVDIAPLTQMTPTVMAAGAHLFSPKPAWQWGEGPLLSASGNGNAQGFFATPNPSFGANISYRVGAGRTGQARIAIVDAIGDTVARLQGPVTPGVHTVTWNYGLTRGTVAAAPLSPSARRDSILRAVRGPKVLDSLAAAKYDSAALAAARPLILGTGAPAGGGGFGGGGGGGGAGGAACERPLTQWDPFCARPGEGLVASPGLAAPAAGGGRGGAAITPAVRKIFELVGLQPPAGGGRGGFGGFGGGGGSATTGDYGVVLRIGDQVFTQKLRVEDVGMSGWAAMYGGNR
jgi:photosystem II stability/assembly factor-like uncharacterized protein